MQIYIRFSYRSATTSHFQPSTRIKKQLKGVEGNKKKDEIIIIINISMIRSFLGNKSIMTRVKVVFIINLIIIVLFLHDVTKSARM